MRKDYVDLYGKNSANGASIDTTTTETEIFRIPIAADELQDGKKFEGSAFFKYSTTGTPTLILGVRAVARAAAATTGVLLAKSEAMVTPAGAASFIGRIEFQFTVRSNGATGALLCVGEATLYAGVAPTVGSATGAPAVSAMGSAGAAVPAEVTVDFTVDKDLLLTAKWSASSSSNALVGLDASIARMN